MREKGEVKKRKTGKIFKERENKNGRKEGKRERRG